MTGRQLTLADEHFVLVWFVFQENSVEVTPQQLESELSAVNCSYSGNIDKLVVTGGPE